jgi:hypothetical protein
VTIAVLAGASSYLTQARRAHPDLLPTKPNT